MPNSRTILSIRLYEFFYISLVHLGTIHKRRRPKGGGRGLPPKGDVGRWGEGPHFDQGRRRFLSIKGAFKQDQNEKFALIFEQFSII